MMTAMQKVVRIGLGAGAVTQPGQAVRGALIVAVVAALIWVVIARTGNPGPVGTPAASPAASAEQITRTLARSGIGPGGSDVRVLWATAEYFQFTQQPAMAAHYQVDRYHVFFLWENIHDGDLPEMPSPVMRVDGEATYLPGKILVPANAVHHRFSVIMYDRTDQRGLPVIGNTSRLLELVLPPVRPGGPRTTLGWTLPVAPRLPGDLAGIDFRGASVLALLAGILASMWPCLFQLTAYFIPSLAGISMAQARQAAGTERLQVMKTAAFFVLGFVVVYTAAGAAAGMAAQSLSDAAAFWSLRRPLSLAAGLIILFMALRVAINARAPLVCRMPGAVRLGRWGSGHLGTMLLGLAFATGCTTCFGAALILGIVAYAGMTATPLYGAAIMLVFSLGMAIPLLAGAAAMARVLAVLGRLEKVAPWMALASSAIMAVFAVLLISGRYMAVSNWILSRATF